MYSGLRKENQKQIGFSLGESWRSKKLGGEKQSGKWSLYVPFPMLHFLTKCGAIRWSLTQGDDLFGTACVPCPLQTGAFMPFSFSLHRRLRALEGTDLGLNHTTCHFIPTFGHHGGMLWDSQLCANMWMPCSVSFIFRLPLDSRIRVENLLNAEPGQCLSRGSWINALSWNVF